MNLQILDIFTFFVLGIGSYLLGLIRGKQDAIKSMKKAKVRRK